MNFNIENPQLLSRDDFRKFVFERDHYLCVICKKPAQDAHHIIERRLFDDGGYYLDNGASLCTEHHILAEQTILSCEEIRDAISKIYIKYYNGLHYVKTILPNHWYESDSNDYPDIYDKWGNEILCNGMRLKGELFFDESVQKILKQGNVLDKFMPYVKHPRTMHLPWSEKVNSDDRKLSNVDSFKNKNIVVSVKLDGEQTTMYRDHIHARSLDSDGHFTRNWVKNLWSKITMDIPDGWRVCGENMYGVHTIKYKNLDSYFFVHSIWNEINQCLSYDETIEWCDLLDLNIVPMIYRGIFDEKIIKELYQPYYENNKMEGYVIRISDKFEFRNFKNYVAKYVSADFEIKHGHWTSKIEKNFLKEKENEKNIL